MRAAVSLAEMPMIDLPDDNTDELATAADVRLVEGQ